jgi:glycosyltransferase involved in cell wall biosynthesis
MISVIIPAHNEERVIGRGVAALTGGSAPGELEVIVVCNGCRDRTAEVARGLGECVRVIETDVPSKANALNLGDAAARGFPRFFVDADVVLTLPELRKLANRLAADACVLAVAPRFQMELAGCSWAVRAFYDINGRLPSAREGIGGSGVYGLSERARQRFERFPAITADDGFVRLQFRPGERETLESCRSIVFAPRTLKDLITIKTRSHYGTAELRRFAPQLWTNRGAGNGAALKRLALRPWLWARLAVYTYVKAMARYRSRQKLRGATPPGWERDETSRSLPACDRSRDLVGQPRTVVVRSPT